MSNLRINRIPTPKDSHSPYLSRVKKTYIHQQNTNNDILILNKDIKKLIDFKKQKRSKVEIQICERFCFYYFYPEQRINKSKKEEKRVKFEFMMAAEKEIEWKSDVLNLWKVIDQLRLLKKIILNENQCFMLNNRDLQTITNKIEDAKQKSIKDLDEEKFQKRKNKLIEYLKNKKSKTPVELLLFKYVDDDLKTEIRQEIEFDLLERP